MNAEKFIKFVEKLVVLEGYKDKNGKFFSLFYFFISHEQAFQEGDAQKRTRSSILNG